MNIIILKWVLINFTLLEVAQPDVTQTTVEMLQSDWAATIVAAKTNPDIGLKLDLLSRQGRSGSAQVDSDYINVLLLCIHTCQYPLKWSLLLVSRLSKGL